MIPFGSCAPRAIATPAPALALLSGSVAERRHEIGIRAALGTSPTTIARPSITNSPALAASNWKKKSKNGSRPLPSSPAS